MIDETSKTDPAVDGAEATVMAASPTKATQGARGGKVTGGGANAGKAAKKPTPAATPATEAGKAKASKATGKTAPEVAKAAKAAKTTAAKPTGEPRQPRTGTKQEKLIAMLKAKDGANVEEIANEFGWQAHTVRGALYGALKKKLGLDVTSEKVEGRGRVYHIAG